MQRNDTVNYSPLVVENETTFFNSLFVTPVEILHSHSAGTFELEIGDFSGAVYKNAIHNVACTKDYCNKRISDARPERSAERPGHMPTRRELVCKESVEDRVAGQDWSTGRLGTRLFGTSTTACSSSIMACLGPYGTAREQLHHTGPNPLEEKFIASSASRLPRHEDDNTIQHQASTSKIQSIDAEDRASLAQVGLLPHRPLEFSRRNDEDVHVWTSIVEHWLEPLRESPQRN